MPPEDNPADDVQPTRDEWDAYTEYTRCWALYLRRIHEKDWGLSGPSRGAFPRRIAEKLPNVTIAKFPTVWPSVELMFEPSEKEEPDIKTRREIAKRLFCEAVRYADLARPPRL